MWRMCRCADFRCADKVECANMKMTDVRYNGHIITEAFTMNYEPSTMN